MYEKGPHGVGRAGRGVKAPMPADAGVPGVLEGWRANGTQAQSEN